MVCLYDPGIQDKVGVEDGWMVFFMGVAQLQGNTDDRSFYFSAVQF